MQNGTFAVPKDGHLVPPKAEQVDLKFPREGISHDDLSDEEKAEWESIDWGDNAQGAIFTTLEKTQPKVMAA
jgi:type I site-specific restriction endonuclease